MKYLKSMSLALLLIAPAFLLAGGDAAKGKNAYATCATCHGQNGEGNKALNAPSLAGQEDWYMVRQIKNFKEKVRGGDSRDIYGMQMAPMAAILANDQAIEDVVAYIKSMKALPQHAPTMGGNAAKGKTYYITCGTCHGQKAEGNQALNAPKLNNQEDWYIVRQLQNYKNGVRGKHAKDIYGMQMAPMAMTLPDEQAMKDVAAYIISLK